jgi:alpha-aminoadipate carrier protein LysW
LVAQIPNREKHQIIIGEKIMLIVSCPECAAEISLEDKTEISEIIVCSDCGVDLEVIALDPAAVQLAPMEQEDWGE